jgi:diketogulonate reductase-like aldo/keto reductase
MNYLELAPGMRLPVTGIGRWQNRGGAAPLWAGIALGSCFVDTAESYGTEEVVARALERDSRRQSSTSKENCAPLIFSRLPRSWKLSITKLSTAAGEPQRRICGAWLGEACTTWLGSSKGQRS